MTDLAMEHLADDLEEALEGASSVRMSRSQVPRELLITPRIDDLLGMAAVDWAWIALAWVGMAVGPWWAWPALALVVTSRLHAFGVILHDAAHQPLKGKGWKVRLLEVLCGYPLATTLNAMRYHHLRHHRDSGMPSDPYFKAGVEESWALYALNVVRGVLLVPFWSVRPWVGLASLVLPGLRNAYGRVWLQDKSGADLTDSVEVQRCAREELGQALFQVPLIGLAVSFPAAFLWGYALPVTASGLLAAWRLLVEHRYTPTQDRRIETILATTNDHQIERWTRWLLAPRNIGYHVVHHIHPQVSLRALPALRDWYRANHPDYPEPR